MRFRNSIRLLLENFKYVYKMLLYKCIIMLVASALCCAFVLPELIRFWNSEQVVQFLENGKEFLKCFVALDHTGTEAAKQAILGDKGSLSGVLSLLSSMTTELILIVVGVVIVYLLKRFVDTIFHFTTGALLNDKMASYAETPFGTSAVSNLGKASLYALVYVPIVFVYDVIWVALGVFILMSMPIFLGTPVVVTVAVLAQSVKLSLTAYWLPAMTNGAKLREAMKCQGKEARAQKWRVFAFYLGSTYFVLIINVLALICSLGSALIITLPASYFFLICAQYVCYYTIKGRKYFISYDNIAANPTCGDCTKLLHYIEKKEEPATAEEPQTTQE